MREREPIDRSNAIGRLQFLLRNETLGLLQSSYIMRYCVYPINRYIIPKRVVGLASDCIRFLRLKLRYAEKINISKIIENENNGKKM